MSHPDLGEKLSLSITNVVNARRAMTEDTSFWSRTRNFFGKSELPQLLGTSLTTLRNQGFLPQDFIEYEIPWKDIKYSTDGLIDFGFTYDHMLTMGFQPDHFKNLEWRHYKKLKINADRMIETCMTIHDLNDLGLTPQQLHQLKWTWGKMVAIGGTKENIKLSASDRNLYFEQKTSEVAQKIGSFVF